MTSQNHSPDDIPADLNIDEIPAPPGQPTQSAPKALTNDFLALARRDLSDEELNSTAVRRFLIADIERLTKDNTELLSYRDRFHEVDKNLGILQSKVSSGHLVEVAYGILLAVGSTILGASPSYFSLSTYFGWFFTLCAVALILAAIAIRVRSKTVA